MSENTFFGDTTLEAARVQWLIFRKMAPTRRFELACAMSDTMRRLVADGVRSRHPEFSEAQVKQEVIRLSLGDELFRKVYPTMEIPR